MKPLPAHDRRLRSGRFEVSAFAPSIEGRRRRISGPHRFATETAARQYAEDLAGDVIFLDRIAPGNARHPEGPWLTINVAKLPGATTPALVAHVCGVCGKRYTAAGDAVVTCAHANTPRHAAKPAVATKETAAA